MELINAIAEYFDVTNNKIVNITATGKNVWFRLEGGAEYTCTLSRGKFLKKNSIRLA